VQTISDVANMERSLDARLDSVRNIVQENEDSTVSRLASLQTHANTEIERIEKVFTDKWTKLGNDGDRQNRLLKKAQEENLKMTQVSIAEVQEVADKKLQSLKQDMLYGQKSFEVEVNKKVDVFRDTIKAMGPEVEDMVRRTTFDMIKSHLDQHAKELGSIIDTKVSEDVIKQELAKKADVMTLGAYARKTDADALVSNAMGEHAKQVEMFLMNTILDNPTKSAPDGCEAEEGGLGKDLGRDRILELESYSIKHGECINDLYRILKDINAMISGDEKSVHYKSFRANPSNYVSARTVTPLSNAHGASLG
jgi:hypothetical protein